MKNIVFFITLFCLFYTVSFFSQEKDSINKYTYDEIADSFYEFKSVDSIKAKKYAEFYLRKAEIEKDTINTIDGYGFLSDVFKDEGIYINYLDSLIERTKKKPSKLFPAYIYLKKGRHYLINEKNSESLKNYLSAIKYTEIFKNDSLKFTVKQKIGLLKITNNEWNESKNILLEVYRFYNKYPKYRNEEDYYSLLSNISSNYVYQKNNDSANFFNTKALEFTKKNNDSVFMGYSFYRQGEIEYNQKKHLSAIDNFKKSFSVVINDENYVILSKSYNYIAKSYSELNNYKEALKYNFLIDSLYQKTNITHKSQKSSYTFLIDHYKEKKDLNNQLKYIEKFLKVDSILNTREKKLAKTFIEEYDTPKLIAEKEQIIQQLEENVIFSNKTSIILGGLAVLSLFLFGYQYQKKKILKHRFEAFIKEQKNKVTKIATTENVSSGEISIPKNIVASIIDKLNTFEENKDFKQIDVTLASLAKDLDTNTNYLSKIINHYKGIRFSKYLNELRINYVLELLNTNTSIRKYTIKAIANEVGFNTAESFSNTFYKKTGLKPSYYIKQLDKLKIT